MAAAAAGRGAAAGNGPAAAAAGAGDAERAWLAERVAGVAGAGGERMRRRRRQRWVPQEPRTKLMRWCWQQKRSGSDPAERKQQSYGHLRADSCTDPILISQAQQANLSLPTQSETQDVP